MGTTNILDLNNRLTKVEKENVAQNNYNSLKNRPKINGNLLTGDKTGTQLGLAEAQDVNKLNSGSFRFYPIINGPYNLAAISLPKANSYTISYITILGESAQIPEAVDGVTDGYQIAEKNEEYGYMFIALVGSYATTYIGRALNLIIDVQ